MHEPDSEILYDPDDRSTTRPLLLFSFYSFQLQCIKSADSDKKKEVSFYLLMPKKAPVVDPFGFSQNQFRKFSLLSMIIL